MVGDGRDARDLEIVTEIVEASTEWYSTVPYDRTSIVLYCTERYCTVGTSIDETSSQY